MKLETDFAPLINHDPSVTDHPAWKHFQRALDGRAFGGETLLDAWLWFREGWETKEKQMFAASTDEWCNTW